MKKYTFCKNDGSIKKSYIEMCKYLVDGRIQHQTITVGRHDEIIDEYDCYITKAINLPARIQRQYIKNIHEICSNFDVMTKEWVYPDLQVELHGEDVDELLQVLTDLLRGNSLF